MKDNNKGEKYMKKKGFTLIELLAVIVILAIIAVITVPKIADMISSSRQGGAEDSFYGTLKAAELGYAKALQSNTDLKGSTCNIEDSKITCTNGVEIKVSGKTPESGVLAISTNGVSGANITLNGYKCSGNLSVSNPCTKVSEEYAADQLKKKLIATGDGIYNDFYDPSRFIYRGKNPDNFLTFNNELWRIVSVENDGTLKIIKNDVMAARPYDVEGNRVPSTDTYCLASAEMGCGSWSKIEGMFKSPDGKFEGTVTKDATLNTYLNSEYYNSLTSEAKEKINTHDFNVGVVENLIKAESDSINKNQKDESAYKWNGKVGLINVTDILKASTNPLCKSATDNINTRNCNDGYLFTNKSPSWFTINGYFGEAASHPYDVWFVAESTTGVGFINYYNAKLNYGVRPVVYLKSSIQLTGTGTESDPYIIRALK